jgi:hypothetical protein
MKSLMTVGLMLVAVAIALAAEKKAVKAALEGIGKVIKVETVTKGARTTYEAQVETKGKKSEVAVDAAGKHIKS